MSGDDYDIAVLRVVTQLRRLLDRPDSQEERDRAEAALQVFWIRRQKQEDELTGGV